MKTLGFKQIIHESEMIKGVLVGRTTLLHVVKENGVVIYSSTSFEDACAHSN